MLSAVQLRLAFGAGAFPFNFPESGSRKQCQAWLVCAAKQGMMSVS
jgi:hypothetical protein